jgi:hypothetical protein
VKGDGLTVESALRANIRDLDEARRSRIHLTPNTFSNRLINRSRFRRDSRWIQNRPLMRPSFSARFFDRHKGYLLCALVYGRTGRETEAAACVAIPGYEIQVISDDQE